LYQEKNKDRSDRLDRLKSKKETGDRQAGNTIQHYIMGSSQSTVVVSNRESNMVPPNNDNLTTNNNDNSNSDGIKNDNGYQTNNIDEENKKKKKKPLPSNLSGFHLVQYKCRKKKKAYDACQSYKHSAFVSGKLLRDNEDSDEISCEELFEIYKECIYRGMHEDRKRRGLPQPKEESALGMFVDDD
jgi:hypothetical protein